MDLQTKELWKHISRAIIKYRGIYAAWSISYNEMLVFYTIRDNGFCTQKQICNSYLLPRQTMNHVFAKLCADGIIEVSSEQSVVWEKAFVLTEKGITFEKLEHEAVYTMEDMNKAGITAKGTVCKNLFLRDAKSKKHFLVTAPEEKRVDLKTLAERIGSTKLSFASADRLSKYLGVEQGCVSPFGILNDESKSVTVVFDQELQFNDAVGVHPNDNAASVWLDFKSMCQVIEEQRKNQ